MQRNRGKSIEWERLQISSRTKGMFHTKIDPIKDRNSKNLTEAEEIKKRRQEYTEELS